MMRALLLTLCLLPLPAFAAMSGEEFEAFVTGKTLTYAEGRSVYGVEEYLPGRRVRWAYIGDQCQEGTWYEDQGQICFVYDGRLDDPQCWVFQEDAGTLSARFVGADDGRQLYVIDESETPLLCRGPDVGV